MKRLSQLTPAETLAMAICIEGANAARHSIWADRFRPYSKEVSKVLDGFAEEDRLSQRKLKNLYHEKYHKKLSDEELQNFDEIVDKSNPDLEHFFVLDDEMSKKIMLSVLKAEYETLVFFQEALYNNKDENMKKVYEMLTDYEKQHVNELKESIEHQKDSIKRVKIEDPNDEEGDEQRMFSLVHKSRKWRDKAKTEK